MNSRYSIACIVLIVLSACGGNLSEEQRKKIRAEMESSRITKVTDVEITEGAYTTGRSVMALLEKAAGNQKAIDSIAHATKTRVRWITPNKNNAEAVEQQLIDAYISGAETGSLQDNVQKVHAAAEGQPDSILYTKPVVKNRTDGSVEVEGTWNITIPQKEIILTITRKKK